MHHLVALANYTQVGLDINGNEKYEQFGSVLSLSDDGNAFVVGLPYAYGNKGAVRVFQKDSNVPGIVKYTQVGLDIVGKATNDQFGSSVSMSGDGTSFVVGAPYSYRDVESIAKGSVSVYKFNPINGYYIQDLPDIVGKVSNDLFGTSVSMSDDGTSFVASAPHSFNAKGSVSVYKQDTTNGNYSQVGSDIVGNANDQLGASVSMSGDGTSFVAGAVTSNMSRGSVSIYKYNNETSNYAEVGLDIVGKAQYVGFGSSLSMSGDGTSFVAGASGSNGNTGSASVYKYSNDTSTFTQIGLDIVGNTNDLFGTSVSMSGDGTSFAVGAVTQIEESDDSTVLNSPGVVRVYKKNSTSGSYEKFGADIVGVNIADQFGTSVSMSSNGATVVVGAPLNDNVNGLNAGHVRLYRDTTASTRVPTTTPTSVPTAAPTKAPSSVPTKTPTASPTEAPTSAPTSAPSAVPTKAPTVAPTRVPTAAPTKAPTAAPTKAPAASPTTKAPRVATTKAPSKAPVFVIPPTETPIATNEKCGFFGWNLFCPRRGKCGFVKRLLNLGNCS